MRTDNERWDMQGKTVLVTGGTGGIGYETARALGRRGARVIITGRNRTRGEDAAMAIERESGQGSVTFIEADHSSVSGNLQLAIQVQARFTGLDVLINNVGGLYEQRWETADGYEATLAMNFVGPFALTAELIPLLRANAPSRCVVVTSAAFKMWKDDPFDDVQSTTAPFIGSDAYARAKLLNLLFGLSLAKRRAADRITVNMVHPGITWTAMTRSQTWRTAHHGSGSGRSCGSSCATARQRTPHDASPSWPPPRAQAPTPASTSSANTSPSASRLGSWTPRCRNEPGSSASNSSTRLRHDGPLCSGTARHRLCDRRPTHIAPTSTTISDRLRTLNCRITNPIVRIFAAYEELRLSWSRLEAGRC
jgi:NAD(P)-dependent dehydrogenase (short-subunit alcohol dehydrogenase family)